MGVSRKKRVPKTQLNGSLAAARAAVGTSWLGMTLVQSRLLVIQLAALLAATGGIFNWYNKYFSVFYQQHPVLALVILGAIPLYILCFSVGPQMWQRRRATAQAQAEAMKEAQRAGIEHAKANGESYRGRQTELYASPVRDRAQHARTVIREIFTDSFQFLQYSDDLAGLWDLQRFCRVPAWSVRQHLS